MNTNFLTNKLRQAAHTALNNVAQVSQRENDPSLRIYQSLQPEDFNAIVKQYGMNNTVQYIQAMETKKMMGGPRANT